MDEKLKSKILKLKELRTQHLNQLKRALCGLSWCNKHAEYADAALKFILENITAQYPELPPLSIVALGGYGRRELSPYSDVELMVLPYDETHPSLNAAIRSLFYCIHNAFESTLNVKVSYAYTTLRDSMGIDPKKLTGIIDSRLVAGSSVPINSYMSTFWADFPIGDFLVAKITEREFAYKRYNDTPYAVEPHLKEGAGGLSCFQCANWIGVATGKNFLKPTLAYEKVLQARNVIHALSEGRNDVLSRQKQILIAELLEIDLHQFNAQITEARAELHEIYLRAVDSLKEGRYSIVKGVEAINGEIRISSNASTSSAAIGVALGTELKLKTVDIPVSTIPTITSTEIMRVFSYGEKTIRSLDRCKLLEKILPEFSACKTLMPLDDLHTFTVFEHTLRVIRYLDRLTPGMDFWSNLKQSIPDPSILYLATLLHDVGKIDPSASHTLTGAQIAKKILIEWNVEPRAIELVRWLIQEHLTMSKFIQMRDITHPETHLEFARIVKDRERLNLLTLLTWADTHAVSTSSWTPVVESFLKELFIGAEAVLQGEQQLKRDPVYLKEHIYRTLKHQNISKKEIDHFLESLPAYYVFGTSADVVQDHYVLAKKAEAGKLSVRSFHRKDYAATEITVCMPDEVGILSRTLGVFYALGIDLAYLKACTTQAEKSIALNVFTITFGGHIVPSSTCAQLESILYSVLSGHKNIDDLLRQQNINPDRDLQISRFQYTEGLPGIIEIHAPVERGLAFRVSRFISSMNWEIFAARIGTWAGQGGTAFYVLGPNQRMLEHQEVIQAFSNFIKKKEEEAYSVKG